MSTGIEEKRRRAGMLRHADRVLARAAFLLLLGLFTLGLATAPSSPEEELSFEAAHAFGRGEAWTHTPEEGELLDERYQLWPGELIVALPFHLAGGGLALAFPGVEERAAERGGRDAWFARLLAGWRGALFTALMGFLLTLAARRLGCTRRVALATGLSFGLTTFAGPAARGFVVEQQVALGTLGAFYLLTRLREAHGRGRASAADSLGFGLALGLALAARPSCLPAVLVLGVGFAFWAWRTLSRRRALRLCGFALIGPLIGVAWIAQPWLADGLLNGARAARPEPSAALGQVGLWSALVSPGAGLLFFAPGVVLVAVGLPRAWKTRRPFLLTIVIALVLALGLPALLREDWPGGWSYGPRPLLACLPFLWIGVAFGLQAASERAWSRRLVALLFGFGLIVQLGGWSVDVRTYRELALSASPLALPELEGLEPLERERALTRVLLPYEPGYEVPWVHWRILRHRVAGMGESYPVAELFLMDDGARVATVQERERGFRHLAWVDLVEGGGGQAWPVVLLCLGLLFAGGLLALKGLDPSAP